MYQISNINLFKFLSYFHMYITICHIIYNIKIKNKNLLYKNKLTILLSADRDKSQLINLKG